MKNKALNSKDIFKIIEENNVKFINFRFTDFNGKWLSLSYLASRVSEDELQKGVNFDGSSVPAWKEIQESDMILLPDLNTAFIDPFNIAVSLVIICDVIDPATNKNYDRDPRNTALKAEKYLKDSTIGDVAYFGPEPEFFVFDEVRYKNDDYGNSYEINCVEAPKSSNDLIDGGNLGNRVQKKQAYFETMPVDSLADMRSEMVDILEEIGLKPNLHHHEVATSQHEIGFEYNTVVAVADNIQKFKYVIKNVANSYNKTATFMPKPIFGDNGSGMHVHQSIFKDSTNLFSGDKYGSLSQTALYYIGGIIKHAKAINAFANSSTNSYKRLVPGFEAPTILAYSAKNRSAAIRIPYVNNDKARRIETRFPDMAGNPYLTFAALLMAGIDGIKNKIDPGQARDENLYELDEAQLKDISGVANSLSEALEVLDQDRQFLLEGGVFTNEQIDAYISLKKKEVEKYQHSVHPIELEMYYNS